ncbi:MAG: hypothetical protein ACJAT2_003249 [Bacteriovoracaceae bacterium]|jgi:hypothetical protein
MVNLGMIIFEIKSSPDKEKIGEIKVFYENFTLGSHRKNDLLIEDDSIDELHLVFVHNKDGLLSKSTDSNFYFTNGKKIKGAKLHKIGDQLKVGETTIEIRDLVFENLSRSFSELYKETIEAKPEIEALIVQLQKELIHQESQKDV